MKFAKYYTLFTLFFRIARTVARFLYVANDIVSNCLFYDAHSVPDSVPSNGRINGDRGLEESTCDLTEVFFCQLRGQTEENH